MAERGPSHESQEVPPSNVEDGTTGKSTSPGDPFADISKLRLSQNFGDAVGAKKLITTVPVRKPNRQVWFRVHPSPDWKLDVAILDWKEDREIYLLDPELHDELGQEVRPVTLHTAIDRQGTVFLWPVRLPDPDGRDNSWNRSAREAAQLATRSWIRMAANMAMGAYEIYEATADIPEPEWPERTFDELIRIAFRDRFVEDLSHPVVKKLLGRG